MVPNPVLQKKCSTAAEIAVPDARRFPDGKSCNVKCLHHFFIGNRLFSSLFQYALRFPAGHI